MSKPSQIPWVILSESPPSAGLARYSVSPESYEATEIATLVFSISEKLLERKRSTPRSSLVAPAIVQNVCDRLLAALVESAASFFSTPDLINGSIYIQRTLSNAGLRTTVHRLRWRSPTAPTS